LGPNELLDKWRVPPLHPAKPNVASTREYSFSGKARAPKRERDMSEREKRKRDDQRRVSMNESAVVIGCTQYRNGSTSDSQSFDHSNGDQNKNKNKKGNAQRATSRTKEMIQSFHMDLPSCTTRACRVRNFQFMFCMFFASFVSRVAMYPAPSHAVTLCAVLLRYGHNKPFYDSCGVGG
jgi:hypothetical protein